MIGMSYKDENGLISKKEVFLKLGIDIIKFRKELTSNDCLLEKSKAFKSKYSYESFKKEYKRIHGFKYTENGK